MALRFGFLVLLAALCLLGHYFVATAAPTFVLVLLMGVVFLALVAAMYLRTLPALLALPILAIALASIAGMNWQAIFKTVVEDGGMRLKVAILAAILGSILAQIVEKTGIAQTAIKKTAELGGDRPMVLAVLLTIVIALLFTTLGGLGAVIMVATIVLPILLSLGLRPLYVGCLFLLGMSLGGAFNFTNWQIYKTMLGMSNNQIIYFALPFAGLMLVATFAFMFIEGKRLGKARYKATVVEPETAHAFVPWYALLTPVIPLLPVLFFVFQPQIYSLLPASMQRPAAVTFVADEPASVLDGLKIDIHPSLKPGESADSFSAVSVGKGETVPLRPGKYVVSYVVNTPVPDIVIKETKLLVRPCTTNDIQIAENADTRALSIVTNAAPENDFPITVALILGILFGAITTWRKGQSTVQLITKSAFDGVAAVGPALVLMIGIGMVLNATMSPEVNKIIQPILQAVVPHGSSTGAMIGYIAFFTILAPLALYRGPLNLWGMGAGLIGALQGLMPAGAIMGAFMSVGMIQGVSDPTNTHNVWIANYTNTDVQDILKRTLPYMWILALVGLILSAVLYYSGVVK
ncbi:MAG TPA: hypothetical protein VGM23_10205 [Armatimonadota bacterium]|jgi:hypothetical protein